ncbi:hypothetical protein PN36_12150 [Candidatus Thiomargarita nelsonii]|uniref:Uncharacterized protein n=1 Tax=Candidatus Thiomargarita nelsonii TaxID=1003181 RepID=A0A4E0R2Y2_9GAMM|nr:hypothetical protein PN36_12150 [Candidatus Thiomargarita nelsonii]
MTHFYKPLICLLLISLSFMAYGEKIVPPVSMAELPTNIEEKSPEELAELMTHIAGWSYQVLVDVPETGLQAQQESLEQVIALRKWLQARQHPLFQLLAFRLIAGVDKAIMNEIFRQEMANHGITVSLPIFKTGSFDEPLLKHLLSLNEVTEPEVIEYAISLEGKIATYCRQQNYPIEDYVGGLILGKISSEMLDYVTDIMYAFPPPLLEQLSKPLATDLLFVQTLGLIDKKRDIRLLTDIYFESGFPNNGKDLENLIKLKLSTSQRIRVSTSYKTTSNKVMNTLFAYTGRDSLSSYGFGITLFILPFIQELDVIPVQELDKLSRKFKRRIGQWLTFKEEG